MTLNQKLDLFARSLPFALSVLALVSPVSDWFDDYLKVLRYDETSAIELSAAHRASSRMKALLLLAVFCPAYACLQVLSASLSPNVAGGGDRLPMLVALCVIACIPSAGCVLVLTTYAPKVNLSDFGTLGPRTQKRLSTVAGVVLTLWPGCVFLAAALVLWG